MWFFSPTSASFRPLFNRMGIIIVLEQSSKVRISARGVKSVTTRKICFPIQFNEKMIIYINLRILNACETKEFENNALIIFHEKFCAIESTLWNCVRWFIFLQLFPWISHHLARSLAGSNEEQAFWLSACQPGLSKKDFFWSAFVSDDWKNFFAAKQMSIEGALVTNLESKPKPISSRINVEPQTFGQKRSLASQHPVCFVFSF